MKGLRTTFLRAVTLILMLHFPAIGLAEVEGNCIMCHKFPGIGRYNKTENDPENTDRLIFYINNDMFETSYHGKLRCKSCHTGVDKIPHTGVPKVDCATDCHLRDPSVNKAFSHKKIVADFEKSAHGKEGSKAEDKSGLPVCKNCHSNKTYHADVEEQIGTDDFLKVCNECHQSREWTMRFFEHMFYRSHKRRPSRDVVKLCSRCHADRKLMDEHNLDVVIGFKETFHAKAISYGNEKVANCLNCHAPYQLGFSPHRITSWRDGSSPVHHDRKLETCRQAGCHAKALDKFAAGGKVHPSPSMIQLVGRTVTTEEKDAAQVLADTIFERKVIGWIVLFYKVLIALVIGGFIVHRSLDIYAGRRERKRSGGGH